MKYNTEFSVHVRPHGLVAPQIRCGINNITSNILTLTEDVELKYNVDLTIGAHKFLLEFANKTNDTSDMAVEIVDVTIEGITLDRFKWNSKYFPQYPEPWASEQIEPLSEFQQSATFLGWNGRWEFYFDVPIFLWIHKLENLGWIYE